MSANNDFVGIRLSDSEMTFLEKIAIEHQLYKKNNEPSLGMAIKHILKEKITHNNVDINNKSNVNDDKIQRILKMIEQINIMIPHLVHASQISTKCLLGKINDTEIAKKIFALSLDETVKKCGQIQGEEYENIDVSNDKNNMKTIPIEENKNQWK